VKALTIIFFSSWKFAATFPLAIYIMRMTFWETLVYTNLGGILGAIVFFYFSAVIIHLWNRYWPEKLQYKTKKRKIFTLRNRRFVRLKMKYGLSGIVLLSPVILSIPLGAFLTVKYYGHKIRNIFFLILGQVFWSLIYTVFLMKIKTVLL
jgi:hypothetical protein